MITNRQLLLPYAAPYLAYVGLASIPRDYLSAEASYLLRLVVVPLLLVWAWRWYCSLRGPRSLRGSILVGAGAGLLGLVVWIGLLHPFVTPGEAEPWSMPAFLLRLASAGLLVPLFEELMMRGFLFRFALQWHRAWQNRAGEPLHTALDERSVNEVEPGAWTWPAVLLSMLAFTSGHAPHEWPAAMAYGLLMTLLWIHRQDLISCVTAHAVTNISLALFVFFTGSWHYW